MKWVIATSFLLLVSCAVTITPVSPKRTRARKHFVPASSSPTAKPKSDQLVDAEWIVTYKQMETERGNFTIRQDEQISGSGDKFHVPQSVLDHYQDMLRAKPSPSP